MRPKQANSLKQYCMLIPFVETKRAMNLQKEARHFFRMGASAKNCLLVKKMFLSLKFDMIDKFQYIEQIKHSRLRPGGGYYFAVSMLRKIPHEIYKSILKVIKSPKPHRGNIGNYAHIPG